MGLTASGLGIVGHAAAGGMLPSATVMAAATGCLVLLGIAMSGRTWELSSLMSVLIGAQLALHVVLADAAHAHTMAGMSDGGPASGIAMTGAHVTAAVVSALLLRRGERWLLALVDLLRRPLRAAAMSVRPVPRPGQLSVPTTWLGRSTSVLADCLSRRGPPLPSLA